MFLTSLTAREIDDALAATFPASDPPAWTPGMARPAPEAATGRADNGIAQREHTRVVRADVRDPTRRAHSARTFAQSIVSLLGAAGLALLAPFAILAVGIPVALAVRGLLELAKGLLSFVP